MKRIVLLAALAILVLGCQNEPAEVYVQSFGENAAVYYGLDHVQSVEGIYVFDGLGETVEVDPGYNVFTFIGESGRTVVKTVDIQEGENLNVTVVWATVE